MNTQINVFSDPTRPILGVYDARAYGRSSHLCGAHSLCYLFHRMLPHLLAFILAFFGHSATKMSSMLCMLQHVLAVSIAKDLGPFDPIRAASADKIGIMQASLDGTHPHQWTPPSVHDYFQPVGNGSFEVCKIATPLQYRISFLTPFQSHLHGHRKVIVSVSSKRFSGTLTVNLWSRN